MRALLSLLVFVSLFFSVNSNAQIYPVHPAYATCSSITTCWRGPYTYTIGCQAQSAQALGFWGPACSWNRGVGFVSCTGYLAGPYGWYWGTDTRFCY